MRVRVPGGLVEHRLVPHSTGSDSACLRWGCGLHVSPPNSQAEIPIPRESALEGGGLWEVIRLCGWSPCEGDWCPYKTGESTLAPPRVCGHSYVVPFVNQEVPLTRHRSANAWILDAQPPELYLMDFCCL